MCAGLPAAQPGCSPSCAASAGLRLQDVRVNYMWIFAQENATFHRYTSFDPLLVAQVDAIPADNPAAGLLFGTATGTRNILASNRTSTGSSL